MLSEVGDRMKLIGIIVFGISLLFLSGCTTLHTAASKGNVKAIDRLAAEGCDLDEKDDEGMTPLIRAINMNQKESVIVLIKNGANVNTPDTQLLNTPLHYAVIQGNSTIARLLIEQKADNTVRNNAGKLPYDLAYEKGNKEMAELLKVKPLKSEAPIQPVKSQKINLNETKNKNHINTTKTSLVSSGKTTGEKEVSANQKATKSLSNSEMSEKLNKMIKGHETKGIRNFLNENPDAIDLIKDSNQRLRYVGPSNWRVIDIADKIRLKEVSEQDIIKHISTAKLPYKKFTQDEIILLTRYGLSYKIINTMMNVSE
jgi:hypothetical protein